MRTWTLVASVCAHAAAIGALIGAPLFATDLPEPRRPLVFESITPITVPDVPAPARPQVAPSPATQFMPVTEPVALVFDTPSLFADPPVDFVAHGGTGVPTNAFAPVGDPVVAPPPVPPRQAPPVRVGGGIRAPTRISYTDPVYPPLAIASRTEGVVILEALLDEQGVVRDVRVLRSIHLLDEAAVEAVSKWRFTPTLLNGTPVPVVMTVTVGFTLKK